MSITPVSFSGTTNLQRCCPIELLEDALNALKRNDPDQANTSIRQLPPGIANQIFSLTWEAYGRPMDRGEHFGKESFFGLNHYPCNTELKTAILEQVIEERSNQLQRAFREKESPATPAPLQSFPGRLISGMARALTRLLMVQPTTPRSLSLEERLMTHIQSANTPLIPDLVRIVAAYTGIIERFGAEEWRHYFQVDVGPEPEFPEELYTFWTGPDPLNPGQRVCDTHLPPALRPARITYIATHQQYSFGIELLNHLAQHPAPGERGSQYQSDLMDNIANSAHLNAGRPAAWLVMRRGVVGRNRFFYRPEQLEYIHDVNRRTGAFYAPSPSVLDLSTIIFTRYVATGERHLGDATGEEQRPTYSFTGSEMRFQFDINPMIIGNFASTLRGNAILGYRAIFNANHDVGIVLLRSFPPGNQQER
jgi:hypothetical protein